VRRQGILVVSMHRFRFWRYKSKVLHLDQVVAHLSRVADQLIRNDTGAVDVRVVAIDATEGLSVSNRRHRPPSRGKICLTGTAEMRVSVRTIRERGAKIRQA